MAKVNFYLRGQTSLGWRVVLAITINGKQLFYSSGFHCEKKQWNAKRQMFASIEDAIVKNAYLDKLEKYALEIETEAKMKNTNIQQKQFVELMNIKTGKKSDDINIIRFIDDFISSASQRQNRYGENIKQGTIRRYTATRDIIAQYLEYTNRKISFKDVGEKFMDDFQKWLTNEKKYSANYIGKTLQITILFMNEARKKGAILGENYQNIKIIKERAEVVVLTDLEVNLLYKYDLSKNVRLCNVRDLFLMGIYTGLRFSDFSTISKENITNDTIRLHQQKTGGLVVIPIHPNLLNMLERRNWEMPHPISSVSFNKYIKELCQIVGINEKVEIKKTIGGERIIEVHEKWELVSAHTARRTFATSLYLRGVAPQTIMQFTGHTTLYSFLNYIVVTPDQQAAIVKEAWKL